MLTPVPSTDCMRARESASARVDGELDELEAARLDAHLRVCEECRAFAGESESLALRLRGAALEVPPAALFVPRARARVRMPLVAAVAAVVVAAVTGTSALVGDLAGRHVETRTLAGTTSPATPAYSASTLLSMLREDQPDGPIRLRAIPV